MRYATGRETHELVRRGEGDWASWAIFAETSVVDGKTHRTMVVYVEWKDITGRPYWEEELDDGNRESFLKWALLHPEVKP